MVGGGAEELVRTESWERQQGPRKNISATWLHFSSPSLRGAVVKGRILKSNLSIFFTTVFYSIPYSRMLYRFVAQEQQ